MKKIYNNQLAKIFRLILVLLVVVATQSVFAQVTYHFTPTGGTGAWGTVTNWTPNGTPTGIDNVIFDANYPSSGSLTRCTVTGVPAQNIGQLQILNGCTATFTSSGTAVLTDGTTGVAPALYVDANSQLIFGGTNSLTLALQPYSVGTVNGDIVDAQTGAVTMALTSLTTNGIIFASGASLQNAPKANVTGSPFSGSTMNSVIFQAGSAYYMSGTKTAYSLGTSGDPWSLTRPASIVNFLSGSSCYVWNPQTGLTTFGGRTVGNLIFDNRAKSFSIAGNTGNGFIVIQNDFIFKGTSVSAISTVNQGGIRIGGNFIVESGSAGFWDCELGNGFPIIFEVVGNISCAGTFVTNTAATGAGLQTFNNRCYILDGTSPQSIYMGSNVPIFSNLSVNNSGGGVTLLSSISITSALLFNKGNIITNGNVLSLGTSLNNSWGILSRNASNNPWIIGNFQRWVPSGTAVAYGFPVGALHYDGATIDFSASAPSGSGFISVSFTTTNPGDNSVSLGPDSSGNYYYDVSSSGYWTINNGVTISGNPNLWLNVNDISGLPNPITQDGIVESSVVYPSFASWSVTGTSASSNSGTLIESAGIALPSGTSYYGIASPTTAFLPPSAGFYASPTSGLGPLIVDFTDTSANNPTSWNWNFGDGIGTSAFQNPTYTYASVGASTTYTVRLIATNSFGSSTATGTVFVTETHPTITRYMWCWNNDSITNNIGTARTDLFNFCAAPFGDTTQAVTVLYYYAEGLIPNSNTNLRSFLQQAHSCGLKVLYLDGDANWVASESGVQSGESFMTTVMVFNSQTNDSTQRFDGVEYDVEPQSATGWSSNETTFWANFTTLVGFCQAQVNTYNTEYTPAIYFEETIGRNWDTDGDPVTSNTQIQDICDSVAVLDFQNTVSNITTQGGGEVSYANSISKKIVLGFETGNYTPSSITFYGFGDVAMDSIFNIVDATFSSYYSYRGIVIEDYDTYRDMACSCTPIADFWSNITTGVGPLTVTFTDGSGNTPTSWNWSFGDGSTSTLENPSHTYAAVGNSTTYTVTLIVNNTSGTSTATRTNYIQVIPAGSGPTAGFYASPTSGHSPLTVNFTDTSANSPSSWTWTFGDGSTSNVQNPTHIYAAVANTTTYSVTLIESNLYGSSTATYNNYITVSPPITYSGGIIWDFDTKNPAKIIQNGYFYVYNSVNTNGINSTSALQILCPYEGISTRHGGGGFFLSNYAGFSLQPTSPYYGTIGNTANNLNLTTTGYGAGTVYFSIMASNTTPFGVCFGIYDTSGSQFVPNGTIYVGDSTELAGTISTTSFQELFWNVNKFHAYKAGKKTGQRAPAMANIEAFQFFFPVVPKWSASGQGSKASGPLTFWIDNVGVSGFGATPVELMNFEAIESSPQKY